MAQFCYNQILIGQTGVYKNAFVPDSASAIPNTVTEQQRILAQVRAGNFLPRVLGVDPEIEPVLGIGGTGHVLDHVKRLQVPQPEDPQTIKRSLAEIGGQAPDCFSPSGPRSKLVLDSLRATYPA
ncbi:MAG: hypothetical protein Q9196_005105 [Gyalolechia fulgens]